MLGQTHTMMVLNFILALILVVAVVHVEPNLGGRVLNMKDQVSLVTLGKGPVPPSGPSGCTYVPGSGGRLPCEANEHNSSFQTYTMRVINFILALILVVAVVHVEPNLGGRVLNMKDQVILVSLDKGPVPPSGPSGCTYIPGSGGTHCHGKEMNVAGNSQHHSGETYPRLVLPFGVETINQD
ncbi:hypothetical protein CR513_29787, partial [Mucuna pruriens]